MSMIIAMTHDMSGGRWDDRQWPGNGVPFEVTDEEGEGSVRTGSAIDLTGKVKREDLPPGCRLPGEAYVTPPAPVSLPAETAAGPVIPQELVDDTPAMPVPGPPFVLEPDGTESPKPADSKQEWYDWAVTQGYTGQQEDITKADLMSKYGGRL